MTSSKRLRHSKKTKLVYEVVKYFKKKEYKYPKESSNYLTLVTLQGWSGDIGHCCTIMGGWIFDVNYPHSLPLCRELINVVCAYPRHPTGMHVF